MERRNSERIEVSWDVDCSTEDTFLFASIRDISELGVFVQTTEPLSIGSEVSLRFHTRDELGVFELRAVVRWINPYRIGGDNRNPGMGLLFIDLSPENRELLVEEIHTIAYLRDQSN